ncbi:MAG: methyltransferase domain-containing protein [Chloroflexota bacterium]
MTVKDRGQVTNSAAEIYDEFYLPALFRQWTPLMINASYIGMGADVLDVACGTGVLARDVYSKVGPDGTVTGLDINSGMLAVARMREPNIKWVEHAAERLPFEANQFDAVVSQFGMMFFEDRETAVSEMVRVLKPGQRLAVAVWDALDTSPGYAALVDLLDRLFGSEIAQGLRSPFNMGDRTLFESYFNLPELEDVSIETHQGLAQFDSISDWVFTDAKGWVMSEAFGDGEMALLLKEAESALSSFADKNGRVQFDAPAHILSAQKVRLNNKSPD